MLWTDDGGYMASVNLSDYLRTAVQPGLRFRQLCDIEDPKAKNAMHRGAVFNWNVYGDTENSGGALTENRKIPESDFSITQGSLTMTEYGHSVPFTEKFDDFSMHPAKEIIRKVLKNNCKKALDTAAHTQFALTPLRVTPTGGTSTTAITLATGGASAITNNVALGNSHVKLIVDTMKERDIPVYDNDCYYAIARPSTYRAFKDDLEAIKMYVETGFGEIKRGEIGKYESVRFIEQTNIAAGTGTTAASAWTNSKSDWCFFMGEDTVTEAIAVPEEIRGRIPGDYGRDKGIAWYALLGFALTHTAAAQARVVMWDSLT